MHKDFKNYTYDDCVDYCLYMKEKFKSAFDDFDSNKEGFRNWYRIIKNELKEDYRKSNLKVNENENIMQYLDINGAYCEFYVPVNSKNYRKMYSELRCSWYDLVYYIKEIKSTDI